MKRLIQLFLILLLVMTGCLAEEDPAVVTVGQISYPLSLARYAMKSGEMMQILGYTQTEENVSLTDSVIENFIHMGIIENQLMEAGKHDLTEDETIILKGHAGSVYDELWQGLKQQLLAAGYEASDGDITRWLETELGCTADVVYQEVLAQEWIARAIGLYCSDVTITTGETVEYLRKYYIEPDQEAYENNIDRYEEEILLTGSESFFMPEGYRKLRQIVLPYPQEVLDEIAKIQPELNLVDAEMMDLREKMADALIEGKDTESLLSEYRGKQEKQGKLTGEIQTIEDNAIPLLAATTDSIYSRLSQGTEFTTLISEYAREGEDVEMLREGLQFHPSSKNWPDTFRRAATALKNPGDVSKPFAADDGIHILQYVEDIPGGVHKLTEEEQSALYSAALQQKQLSVLGEQIEKWRSRYTIKTNPELLENL